MLVIGSTGFNPGQLVPLHIGHEAVVRILGDDRRGMVDGMLVIGSTGFNPSQLILFRCGVVLRGELLSGNGVHLGGQPCRELSFRGEVPTNNDLGLFLVILGVVRIFPWSGACSPYCVGPGQGVDTLGGSS